MSKRKTNQEAEVTTPETQTAAVATLEREPGPRQEGDAPAPVTAAGEAKDTDKQSWVKRSSIIVDPEAGMKFHFDYERHTAIITFNEKPSPELLAVVKPIVKERGGFHWDGLSELPGWTKKISFENREQDRRDAKRTFHEAANAVREHKGLPVRSFGESVPF